MATASLIVQLYFDKENLDKKILGLNGTKSIQAIEIKELKEEIVILNNQITVLKNQEG
ncbi:MAG: hypothetical protein OFPI_39340 [Osedax symbiont Rs2]|nr:MAG: hypothetical protein OFPI_39340 [Osedax symbiont Rs2]